MKKQIYYGDLVVQTNFGAKRGKTPLPPEFSIAKKAVWKGESMDFLNEDDHTVGQVARILKIKDKSKLKIIRVEQVRKPVGFSLV